MFIWSRLKAHKLEKLFEIVKLNLNLYIASKSGGSSGNCREKLLNIKVRLILKLFKITSCTVNVIFLFSVILSI